MIDLTSLVPLSLSLSHQLLAPTALRASVCVCVGGVRALSCCRERVEVSGSEELGAGSQDSTVLPSAPGLKLNPSQTGMYSIVGLWRGLTGWMAQPLHTGSQESYTPTPAHDLW